MAAGRFSDARSDSFADSFADDDFRSCKSLASIASAASEDDEARRADTHFGASEAAFFRALASDRDDDTHASLHDPLSRPPLRPLSGAFDPAAHPHPPTSPVTIGSPTLSLCDGPASGSMHAVPHGSVVSVASGGPSSLPGMPTDARPTPVARAESAPELVEGEGGLDGSLAERRLALSPAARAPHSPRTSRFALARPKSAPAPLHAPTTTFVSPTRSSRPLSAAIRAISRRSRSQPAF